MDIKRTLVLASLAMAFTLALPVVDAGTDTINLGSSAQADWDDNDEARRTARRTARRVERRHDAMDSAKPVTVLPAGCYTQVISGIAYQNCNGVLYQQMPGQPQYVIVQPAGIVHSLPTGCISKVVGSATFFECGVQVYKSVVMNGATVYQLQ
ncbi:hypothetical protein [Neptuniibacter caesariensis]|uniref:Secreted protein n=1 Tax=Neptuniibacter caesariensis TaxID=207954 RepID=A0A7U8GTK2_NEPCE|nr:hypothetical protein [Neptuniibacter caesariensis]EAR62230.1 hypothetical protein MED92_14373 [Oceanospirillum sp. MED92] [Neptuniibacter caesariensis]